MEARLECEFENLAGWCKLCGLITHFGRVCEVTPKISISKVSSSGISKLAGGIFSSLGSKTTFTAGSTSVVLTAPIPRAPMTNLFATLERQVDYSKERRVVTIRPLGDRISLDEPHASAHERAVVLGKRVERDPVLSASPKKLKPEITVRRSIAGMEAFGLVSSTMATGPKKRGRPIGAKNKKSGDTKAKKEPGTLCLTFPMVSPSLPGKGKEKV